MADPTPTQKAHHEHIKADGSWSGIIKHVTDEDDNFLEVEICDTCHWIKAKCIHNKCTWKHREDCTGTDSLDPSKPCSGCRLECVFCGIDAT